MNSCESSGGDEQTDRLEGSTVVNRKGWWEGRREKEKNKLGRIGCGVLQEFLCFAASLLTLNFSVTDHSQLSCYYGGVWPVSYYFTVTCDTGYVAANEGIASRLISQYRRTTTITTYPVVRTESRLARTPVYTVLVHSAHQC
jgi:hypothetical protein